MTHQSDDLPTMLQNIPAELPGVVCVQYVTRGKKRHAYFARFWRERGKLRKQYIRKADVEAVRAACAARQEREGERMKTRALMVAAFGTAAVEAQRRQVRQMLRDAVGDNTPAAYKQRGFIPNRAKARDSARFESPPLARAIRSLRIDADFSGITATGQRRE